jgi:sugar phosphate isomerase/epimerase
MKPLALSTMYAQQDRFADGATFARYAAEAGYEAIEISHSTREDKLRQIVEANVLPVTSVHQPAPWLRHADGRGNSHCNLASTNEAERTAALEYALASIEWATSLGVDRLVVHLGQVTDCGEQFEDEREMRRMFDSGKSGDARFVELREAAVALRARESEPFLARARESLLTLVRAAAPRGIAIGLENRYHYHEIPQPAEFDFLLDGLSLDEAGYWHDTGHAEVLDRLGFIDRHAWLDTLSERCIGAHLHDVSGIGDHRAPGDGDVDWGYITAGLKHLSKYTLEINQHQPDERVAGSVAFLQGVGLR